MSVGAGGMYLALRRPWGGHAIVPSDGPAVVIVSPDAAVGKPKKKKRHGSGVTGTQPGQDSPRGPDGPGADNEIEETEPPPAVLTAADRSLEWRGDETAIAPQKIDMTSGSEARPLDDNEINATINNQAGGVRDCVIQGATGTDLHATITVKLVVDGKGRVIKSKLQAPHYLFDKGLLGCTQRALGKMHFPATGASTLVTLPVTLG